MTTLITDATEKAKISLLIETSVSELLKDRVQRTVIAMKKLKKALGTAFKAFPQNALKTAVQEMLAATLDAPSKIERLKSFLFTF